MSGIIDSAFASNSQSAADVAATLNTLASSVEKVTAAYQSLQNSVDDMADKVISMLYTLADKFLDGIELDEIKEAMSMTRLGQMIMDDGIKIGEMRGEARGREAGKKEGIAETQKKMNSLINILLTSNRTEDCLRASKDADYRKKLMDELGLK